MIFAYMQVDKKQRKLLCVLHKQSVQHVLLVRSLVTGLEWPRGFQEVKDLRFHDNGTSLW
jgi:hypothetical protein